MVQLMTKIIVMLVWFGWADGRPATIQGFATLDSCNSAITKVIQSWDTLLGGGSRIRASCIELDSGATP
jgi:hypothetical protein